MDGLPPASASDQPQDNSNERHKAENNGHRRPDLESARDDASQPDQHEKEKDADSPSPDVENDSETEDEIEEPVFTDPLRDLGLPADYDPEKIPTMSSLRDAAIYAVDQEIAFLLLHSEHPQAITERLEEIAGVALAAARIPGPHQARAVRLGLALEVRYWLAANKIAKWFDLLSPLLVTVLEMADSRLQTEIYRAWSIYLFSSRSFSTNDQSSERALIAALECANEAKRDDLHLLIQAEKFNLDVRKMTWQQAQAEAEALLAAARQLRFAYVKGRVYLSLALFCRASSMPDEAFTYAQQGLAFFYKENIIGHFGDCLATMFNSLHLNGSAPEQYAARLLEFLEKKAAQSVSPFFQASVYYAHALRLYHQKRYDNAREMVLKTWLIYHRVGLRSGARRVQHMLGMIQTKRGQWWAAEHHLQAAFDFYELTEDIAYMAHAQHSLALISYARERWLEARTGLLRALSFACKIPEETVRLRVEKAIEEDLREVEAHLRLPEDNS